MGIRDVLITLTVVGSLPWCFTRPWIGMLMWYWLAYMNPHRQSWGFAYDMRFAQMVAVTMLAGFVFARDRRPFVWCRESVLMLLFWLWVTLSTVFAVYPDSAFDKWTEFSKVLLTTFLIIPLFQDRQRLRWLLLVIVASLGYFGTKGGIFVLMTGGQWMVWGPSGSFIEGNTELALALNMCLPIFIGLARDETRRWARRLLWGACALTVVAIPFTYSRGGVLGLAAVATVLVLRSKAKRYVVPAVVAAVLVLVTAAPEHWVARMYTIKTYDEDQSANLRLKAWSVARMIAFDSPVFGGGFNVLQDRRTYDRYMPDYLAGKSHNAHSLYFNLLAEHGLIGFTIFMLLSACALLTLRRLRKSARARPDLAWVGHDTTALETSLIGYFVSGAFLSVAYFDMAYQLFAMVIVLRVIVAQELAAGGETAAVSTPTVVAPAPARRALPIWRPALPVVAN